MLFRSRLLTRVNEIASRKYADLVGHTVEILVEGPSRKNPARYEGRTRSNRIVVFEGDSRHIGELLNVQVERAGAFTLYGIPALRGLDDEPVSATPFAATP